MLRKILNTTLIGCLSFLLIFGSTSKEFIHLFSQHQDTEHAHDHVCPQGETHLEEEHHHCAFLHYVLDVYAHDAFIPYILYSESTLQAGVYSSYSQSIILRIVDHPFLRGPPRSLPSPLYA